jgi:hypothetical protein
VISQLAFHKYTGDVPTDLDAVVDLAVVEEAGSNCSTGEHEPRT